jgi:hypothetical protein
VRRDGEKWVTKKKCEVFFFLDTQRNEKSAKEEREEDGGTC